MPGQDLTRVTIPSFFLEPRSLLERLADTLMHPDVLLRACKAPTPLERMKLVVAWFLSGFHYKTVVRLFNRARVLCEPAVGLAAPHPRPPSRFRRLFPRCVCVAQGVKKPYNPVIGETFACCWQHDDGSRSQYFSEQVAHRPPVSAIYFENRQNAIVASAHVWTKSQFSAPQTVKSILEGACLLNFTEHGEVRRARAPAAQRHCPPPPLSLRARAPHQSTPALPALRSLRCAALALCRLSAGVLHHLPDVLCAQPAARHAAHGHWRHGAHHLRVERPARRH